MKATIYIAILLLLSSCSILHKSKSLDYKQTDSVSVSVKDTLSSVQKDSVFTKLEQRENVNEIVIEGDSLSLVTYLPNYHESDSVQPEYPVERWKVDAADYFPQVKGKVKKITIRNSQTENKNELVQFNESAIQQGHNKNLTKVDKTKNVQKESESRCSFPLWSIIVLLLITAVIYWAWRRYKSFPIIHL